MEPSKLTIKFRDFKRNEHFAIVTLVAAPTGVSTTVYCYTDTFEQCASIKPRYARITLMKWNLPERRVYHVQSSMYEFGTDAPPIAAFVHDGGVSVKFTGGDPVAVTDTVTRMLNEKIAIAVPVIRAARERMQKQISREFTLTRSPHLYLQGHHVESTWDPSVHIPSVCGFSQVWCANISDSLRIWPNCVVAALLVLGTKHDKIKSIVPGVTSRGVVETILAVALRFYAGEYPDKQETVDDRTMRSFRFFTNSDCDDASIEVAARVHALMATRDPLPKDLPRNVYVDLASRLLAYLRRTFIGPALVCGIASPETRNPKGPENRQFGGHFWTLLIRGSPPSGGCCLDTILSQLGQDAFRDALLVEPTRATAAKNRCRLTEYSANVPTGELPNAATFSDRNLPVFGRIGGDSDYMTGAVEFESDKYVPITIYTSSATYVETAQSLKRASRYISDTISGEMTWERLECNRSLLAWPLHHDGAVEPDDVMKLYYITRHRTNEESMAQMPVAWQKYTGGSKSKGLLINISIDDYKVVTEKDTQTAFSGCQEDASIVTYAISTANNIGFYNADHKSVWSI